MLASCAGFVAIATQIAYAASNIFLNAFDSYRKNLSLTAYAIDLGVVANAGYVIENKERTEEILAWVQDILTEDEVLALVKAAITGEFAGNDDHQTLTRFKLWPDKTVPSWALDPKFSHVLASV